MNSLDNNATDMEHYWNTSLSLSIQGKYEQFEEDWTTMWNPQGLEHHDCSAEFI